jgi:hypothetical protein
MRYLQVTMTLTKVVSLQVCNVSKKIVQREQTSFAQGQFIEDTMISAWEAIESTRESDQQGFFLKIEFDKAYDLID